MLEYRHTLIVFNTSFFSTATMVTPVLRYTCVVCLVPFSVRCGRTFSEKVLFSELPQIEKISPFSCSDYVEINNSSLQNLLYIYIWSYCIWSQRSYNVQMLQRDFFRYNECPKCCRHKQELAKSNFCPPCLARKKQSEPKTSLNTPWLKSAISMKYATSAWQAAAQSDVIQWRALWFWQCTLLSCILSPRNQNRAKGTVFPLPNRFKKTLCLQEARR
jgi:hypothetical protein